MESPEAAPGRVQGEWRMGYQEQMRDSQDRNPSSPRPTGATCEKTPQQGSEETQCPALIQQEEEDLPSLKEEATESYWYARLKSSLNPPRPLSLDYRVDRLRK